MNHLGALVKRLDGLVYMAAHSSSNESKSIIHTELMMIARQFEAHRVDDERLGDVMLYLVQGVDHLNAALGFSGPHYDLSDQIGAAYEDFDSLASGLKVLGYQ